MSAKVLNNKFFTLSKMLRMSDLEDLAVQFGCTVSYITKVISPTTRKFDLEIFKAACLRAKHNIDVYTLRIDGLLQDVDRLENHSDEKIRKDIEWINQNFKDVKF